MTNGRFERDDSLSRAAAIVSERVRALPEFAHARSLVVAGAFDECRGRSVGEMRALGGFTEVLRRHVAALPGPYHADRGSRLLPRSVASELLAVLPALREELQLALCRAGGGQ